LDPIQTTEGSVYSHLHPDRTTWLPGAASSCGGGCLPYFFPGVDFAIWDQQALSVLPTGWVSYPLCQVGERFPIADAEFGGFLPSPHNRLRFYGSLLEGVAYVERLGIERLQALGVRGEGSLFTVGGGCRSPLWLQIRASILQKSLLVPRYNQPAVGAAILAAAGFWQCSVTEAVKELVHLQDPVDPVADWVDHYDAGYQEFCDRLESRFPLKTD
jgi:xylulokinase